MLTRKSMNASSVAWLLLVISTSSLVRGQFPAVCNTEDSLASKTCCPNNCGAHGDCVDISIEVTQSWNRSNQTSIFNFLKNGPPGYGWPMDVRFQWPLRVFQKVCQCKEGWGGYDCCSRCDFGYIEEGEKCVKQSESQLYERKEFSKLSEKEQDEYFDILKEAKNEAEDKMVWAVVTEEPMDTDDKPTFKLQNVSTYDMLVVLHFLSAREKDNKDCTAIFNASTNGSEIDFAHEFSGFITWHRYYLLILESELRRIAAERLGISNFAIAYWDWKPNNEDIFNDTHFGKPFPGTITKGMPMDVKGQLFKNGNWPVVCNEPYIQYLDYIKDDKTGNCTKVRELCNVQKNRAQNIRLQRGALKVKESRFLPGDTSIQMALAADDNNEYDGFRKRLEGFVGLCAGNETKCTISNVDNNNLHNAVHIYIGGHMRVVSPASNDPIFFLHHANIDRILESWFQYNKLNGNLPPFSVNDNSSDAIQHPGYSEDDYLIPMFPLKTNADMYKTADEFGYKYDELPPMPTETYERCSDPRPTAACLKDGYNPDGYNPDGYNPDSASALYQMASLPFLLVLAYTAHYINFL